MNQKEKFIKFMNEEVFSKGEQYSQNEDWEDVVNFWEAFSVVKEKPMFTENGKKVMEFLQNADTEKAYLAKTIAENLFVSGRTVAGTLRKLVSDGFVDKTPNTPRYYKITEKGKQIDLNVEEETE